MSDQWKAAKVGAMLVAAVLITWGVYRFVEERSGGKEGYSVWAHFSDVQGLVPKSRVLIAGIAVGYIEDIRLDGARAKVTVRIRNDVPLYLDASIAKKSASLLGESMLVLHPGSATKPRLKDGDRIRHVAGGAGTDEIMTNVNETAKSVRLVAAQLARAFGDDKAGNQMRTALADVSAALAGIRRIIDGNEAVVGRTLGNVEAITSDSGPKIARILANVEQSTQEIRELIGNNKESLDQAGGTIGATASSIHRSARELEEILRDVHQISERTAEGKGTIGRLTKDETLIDEVEGVVEGVGSVVGGISRLQTIVGLRAEYNMLANTFKSYVSLRLQPREDRYYLIQLVDDPRGLTRTEQTTTRTSPPSNDDPAFQQQTKVTTRDAFRFSLMFAKRVQFATFRFGILESTGGGGADLHFFDDDLELNVDLFAFGEQTFPRLRARLAYEILQRFYILGGVDDMLNRGSTDFFLGAGLRFNDRDLKSILPFAGGALSATGG
ncbi:MAG: MlaD family protein [Polyangiales bacterium]